MIPRSHLGDLRPHCPGKSTVAIPDNLLPADGAVPLPMHPGSVLLMHQRTIHSSLDNLTEDEVRLSFDLRYQPIGQPTGRPAFPGFIARSRQNPASALTDWRVWANLWRKTRARLAQVPPAGKFTRWTSQEAICA